MDTLKAILNQILLFFDAIGERFRRLPARGRRRVFFLALIFLLLVVLLSILCISSCHREDAETVAEAVTLNERTRVRGTVEAQDAEEESGVRVSSDAHPIYSGSDPVVETSHATWAPEQSGPEEEPGNDEPEEEPEDEPEGEPEPTPEPSFEPEEEPTPEPTPEPSEEPEDEPVEETPEIVEPEETPQYAQLKKHDKSDAVTTLQYRLMELGYLDIDEPTNYFGSSTESALILFQRQHDLKQDGVAGNETQIILYSDAAQHYMLKEGAEGQDVKALQEQLVDLGYLSASDVDRIYGPVTIAAVQAFQKRNGLHVDGLAGEKTLELLYSDEAKMSREMQKKMEAEAAAGKKAESAPKARQKKASAGRKAVSK